MSTRPAAKGGADCGSWPELETARAGPGKRKAKLAPLTSSHCTWGIFSRVSSEKSLEQAPNMKGSRL